MQYKVSKSQTPEDFKPVVRDKMTVVWLATVSTPGSSAGRPLDELFGNLQPLISLLQIMQRMKDCRIIYLSSGGALYGDVLGGNATEEMPLRPKSYYGAGKASAEHFITAWSYQFHKPALILRPSNIYGPGQTIQEGFGIIPTAFDKLLTKQPITIWGDGKSIRDYLFIDDFISLFMKVLEKPIATGTRVLNAASGVETQLNHLLTMIEDVSGKKFEFVHKQGRSVDIGRILIDNTTSRLIYAWQPKKSLYEGLKQTWTWFTTLQR